MGSTFWAVLIGLIIGLAVGGGLTWLFASRRSWSPSARQLKEENERFREEVNAHFVQTAELINELTDSYKKVFDHLSDGAERLVDKDAVRERMPQVGRQEVRLRHIGAPKDYRPSAQSERSSSSGRSSSSTSKSPDDDSDDHTDQKST